MKLRKVSTHRLTLILDAYNVIHAIPELERTLAGKLEHAREALILYCRQYQEKQGNIGRVVLVFDGKKTPSYFWNSEISREGDIEIVFSDADQTADDKIIELLSNVKNPENFAVVSNDNYVANNARAHGVRVLSVSQLHEAVQKKRSPNVFSGSTLVPDQARKITEEYRQYLGIKD